MKPQCGAPAKYGSGKVTFNQIKQVISFKLSGLFDNPLKGLLPALLNSSTVCAEADATVEAQLHSEATRISSPLNLFFSCFVLILMNIRAGKC